jgi:hypothetical protein
MDIMTPVNLALAIILIVFLIVGLPQWGWHSAGPWPSGISGLLLLILLLVILLRI